MKKLIVVLLLLVPVSVWGWELNRFWFDGNCYKISPSGTQLIEIPCPEEKKKTIEAMFDVTYEGKENPEFDKFVTDLLVSHNYKKTGDGYGSKRIMSFRDFPSYDRIMRTIMSAPLLLHPKLPISSHEEPKCHWEIKRILATSGTTIPLGWEPFGVTTKYDFFNLANGIPLMIPQIDYCHLWLRRKVCEGEK